MSETFGKMEVRRGESCSNSAGIDDRWTTPCCYEDVFYKNATECPGCGAPIVCKIEYQPVCVCTIPDEDEED